MASSKSKAGEGMEIAVDTFHRDGYLIIRNFTDPALCGELDDIVDESLDPPLAPLEYEADVHYPGAPSNKASRGGFTPRRLLSAYTRHELFRRWALSREIIRVLAALIDTDRICLSQNHHNCVMTKYPGFSSLTSWHQDIRYWRFDRPELVSVWLALGPESPENGGLSLIPGSHTSDLGRGRLDASLFLRTDLEENRAMIDSAVAASLNAGDVLFFHCKTYHAAGRNQTERVKKSLVFTYRAANNEPIPETRSAVYRDIEINQQGSTE
jgi:phytanoyl-CoA hydroxylase